MTPPALFVGLAAGLATALLFAGLVVQSASAVGLSLAAPIPIFLASLGWGSRAGFLAAGIAAGCIAVFTASGPSGLTLLATIALPAALIGHLAGLARPSDETQPSEAPQAAPGAAMPGAVSPGAPRLDWYPIPRILFAIALAAAAGCLFLGWLVGYDPQEITPAVTAALVQQGSAGIDAASEAQIQELAAVVVRLVPFAQPASLVLTFVTCLYLAAAITRMSGRLPRPKDDIPFGAGLPKAALGIFAVALAGCFLGGTAATAAAVVAGAFAAAFALVGLAALHRRTRGRASRGLLLFATYTAILLLSFPAVPIFVVLGLFETAKRPAPIFHA